MKKLFTLIVLGILLTSCFKNIEKADMVILNANIITLEDSIETAQAIAIKDGLILALGTNEEISELIGSDTKTLRLNGETIIPGIIESHAHFMGLGKFKTEIDLRNTKNWDEIVSIVAQKAANLKKDEWIIGRAWHQEKWDKLPTDNVEGFPIHKLLTEAAPLNPVFLVHASGHAAMVNKRALELANITNDTENPFGGEIVKDKNGEPTGMLKETAKTLIQKAYNVSQENKSEQDKLNTLRQYYLLANSECLEKGITSLHDAGESFSTVDLYKSLIDEGKKGVRLNVMLSESNNELKKRIKDYKIINYGDNYLTVRTIKRLIDGALGARSALFFEDYADQKNQKGLMLFPEKELTEVSEIAADNQFQLAIHCIGDKANNIVINEYETFYNKSQNKDLRWRIEHAQHLIDSDIKRFGEIGIIAAMQPNHCTSDAIYVEQRIGKKRAEEGAYVWQKLIKSGAIICSGTDSPVEEVDPIKNFYSAVTRKTDSGFEFYPDQKMTRIQALKSFTINGAYAAFEENIKGSIKKSKLADLTILSKNILTIPDEEILETKVLYTIVGGKVLYKNENIN